MVEKYEPGRWVTGRDDMQSYTLDGEPFTNIYHETETDGWHKPTNSPLPLVIGRAVGKRNKENAKIFAAGPQMIDALEFVRDFYQEHFDIMPVAFESVDALCEQALKAAGRAE